MVYPAFGIVFANGINGFSQPDAHDRRFQGDRTALWYVAYHARRIYLSICYNLGSFSLLLFRL